MINWTRCPTPTIHLNGTNREDLLEQRLAVARACSNLREALAKATPHGRDYYLQGPDAPLEAWKIWGGRLGVIAALEILVREEAEEIADADDLPPQ